MKKGKRIRAIVYRTALGVGLLPMLAFVGCEPVSAESLQTFVVEFARSAASAWLL